MIETTTTPATRESLTDRTIQSDGVVKCPKCGHAASPSELIQTLWADAITMVDRPDVTIKAGVTRDDAADTASSATFTISDRISLRPQALGEAGSNVTSVRHAVIVTVPFTFIGNDIVVAVCAGSNGYIASVRNTVLVAIRHCREHEDIQ